jgi:hypothetical protein
VRPIDLLGVLASGLAAAWKFIGFGSRRTSDSPLDPLYDLAGPIRDARSETDLAAIEERIDNISIRPLRTKCLASLAGRRQMPNRYSRRSSKVPPVYAGPDLVLSIYTTAVVSALGPNLPRPYLSRLTTCTCQSSLA